ncbi:hypothetical protein A0J61_11234 [Choanephora cucurbitarum]|uniref:Uncharacterized protein n=1 Tax=Choanephora cucurbitarum TaxID=101091 RepID=A0A1C7MVC4_9FUNG|nr:hypothetical protein A0J61_11234 [Choanephora cucurbitarum]
MTGDMSNDSQQQQRLYTEAELQQIISHLRNEEKQATEDFYATHDLPLEIAESCDELSRTDKIDFTKRFKKRQPKFYHENITVGEQLNKNYIQRCKARKTETIKTINCLYKISENTRAAARGATDLYGRIKLIKQQQDNLDRATFNNLLDEAIEIAHNLSVFSWTEASLQDDEAREFAVDALHLPNSIKHLGGRTDTNNKRDAFDAEFVQAYNEATYQRSIIQAAVNPNTQTRGGFRGRGFHNSRGNTNRGFRGGGHFWNKGRGGGPSNYHNPPNPTNRESNQNQ